MNWESLPALCRSTQACESAHTVHWNIMFEHFSCKSIQNLSSLWLLVGYISDYAHHTVRAAADKPTGQLQAGSCSPIYEHCSLGWSQIAVLSYCFTSPLYATYQVDAVVNHRRVKFCPWWRSTLSKCWTKCSPNPVYLEHRGLRVVLKGPTMASWQCWGLNPWSLYC